MNEVDANCCMTYCCYTGIRCNLTFFKNRDLKKKAVSYFSLYSFDGFFFNA